MSVDVAPNDDVAELIPLSVDEIHLWLVDYEEIGDERLHAEYRELLTAKERAQEPRFYFARDRRRYLITRDKFSFQYAHDRAVALAVDQELGDDAARWQFWQFRPTPEYLVAVCAERVDDISPRLTIRQAVPLASETELIPEILRVSHSH